MCVMRMRHPFKLPLNSGGYSRRVLASSMLPATAMRWRDAAIRSARARLPMSPACRTNSHWAKNVSMRSSQWLCVSLTMPICIWWNDSRVRGFYYSLGVEFAPLFSEGIGSMRIVAAMLNFCMMRSSRRVVISKACPTVNSFGRMMCRVISWCWI